MRLGPWKLALGSIVLAAPTLYAQTAPTSAGWQQRLQERREQLVKDDGPGTEAALRTELLAMLDDDQRARGVSDGKAAAGVAFAPNLAEIDRKLTDELKGIVAAHGWPTIQLVGIDASNGAMTILTHSPDHDWQRTLVPTLEPLARDGKIDGSTLAVMIDKQLVSAGKLQRYGTQFKVEDGQAMMFAVEDPSKLEERRAQVLLPPLDVYKKMLSDKFHMPISDMIIRADVPK